MITFMRIPTGPLDPALKALFDPYSLPDKSILNEKGYIDPPEDETRPSKWISPETMRYQELFLLKIDAAKRRRKLKRTTWRP
jgi:hypothetical protein